MARMRERGSLSIEAAVEISVFSFLVFGLICVIQFICVYAITYRATMNSAEKVAEYSCIFFKNGLDSLSNSVKAKAINAVGTDDGDFNLFTQLASEGLDAVSDEAFKGVCRQVVQNELKSECEIIKNFPIDIQLESLDGSSFFRKGNEFRICVKVKSDFLFPFILVGKKNLSVSVKINGNAWIYGAFSGYNVSEINVWKLDKFKRGTVVENVFGGNLPKDFPTIDIYDEKAESVTMIVSVDTTLDSYQKGSDLKKKLKADAEKLIEFEGASAEGVTVNKSDYKTKKMLLVIPENVLNSQQMNALSEIGSFLGANNVKFETVSYQRSEMDV